jgi:hypothetical protein
MVNRTALQLALVALVASTGCGRGDRSETAQADSLSRDLQLAPLDTTAKISDAPVADTTTKPVAVVDSVKKPTVVASTPAPVAPKPKPVSEPKPKSPAMPPAPTRPATFTAPAGRVIMATVPDTITSRHNKPGETIAATVTQDIKDDKGNVAIPAGSTVFLKIVELAPAENKSQKDGKLKLEVTGLTVRGQSLTGGVTVDSVQHFLKGRKVNAGDAAKVGGGAAAGAVVGGLIGKGKGALIGAIIGAAGGTAVAVETADRDVVIPAGGVVHLSLRDSLVVPAK